MIQGAAFEFGCRVYGRTILTRGPCGRGSPEPTGQPDQDAASGTRTGIADEIGV